jgi:hypothetical protein
MDRRPQDSELVALSTVSALVYKAIMGVALERMEVSELNQILHGVAHALSNVAPIYGAISETATAKALPPGVLLHGAFERGATVFRTRTGIQYRQLSMQRGDMRSAIIILGHAGARFGDFRSGR